MSVSASRLLNTAEMEAIVRDEKDRRRLLRLDQVRTRSRENSSRIVGAVKNERRRQKQLLRQTLENEWKARKRERLDELGTQYGDCLLHVGDAHRAVAENENDVLVSSQQQERNIRASTRGRDALAKLSAERAQLHQRLLDRNLERELVRRMEDERAKQVASLPPPLPPSPPSTVDTVMREEPSHAILLTHDVTTDARETARIEADRLRTDEVDRRHRESAQLALEKQRFVQAHAKMELQRKYNSIMDDLEKIAEAEMSTGEGVEYDPDAKRSLMAEQEALVEELFNRFSIPVVSSVTSGESSVCTTETPSSYLSNDESIVINHVLVSSDDLVDSTSAAPEVVPSSHGMVDDQFIRRRIRSLIVSDDGEITSDSTPTDHGLSSPPADDQETILASHPYGSVISSVGIDLSSYAFDDESSTKWPQSTVESSASRQLFPSSYDDDGDPEAEHNLQAASDDRRQDKANEEPIFRNVEVRRHALHPCASDTTRAPHASRGLDSDRIHGVDKSSYLRRLLCLALESRVDKNDGGIVHRNSQVSTSSNLRSPIVISPGLADLKESFRKAQASLQAELEMRGKRLEGELLANGYRSQAALSTIIEVESSMDDGDSLLHRQWPLDENGITDEPDLTLVCSSESSRDSTGQNTPLTSKPPEESHDRLDFGKSATILLSDSSSTFSANPLSKFSTPSLSSSSSGSWFSCLSNRRILRKPAPMMSTLDLSESSGTSMSLPNITTTKSQKSICLSRFFDTTASTEHSAASCPICQSSISESDNDRPQYKKDLSSSSSEDSLNSFLRHEMSANNGSVSGASGS